MSSSTVSVVYSNHFLLCSDYNQDTRDTRCMKNWPQTNQCQPGVLCYLDTYSRGMCCMCWLSLSWNCLSAQTQAGKQSRGNMAEMRRKEGERAVPSIVPHLVFLPSSLLPLTWYSWSLPTTANGIISCSKIRTDTGVRYQSNRAYIKTGLDGFRLCCCRQTDRLWSPHPNLLVYHPVLCIFVKFLLWVHVNPVGSQLFPDLVRACSNIHRGMSLWPNNSLKRIQTKTVNCCSN